LQCSMTGMKKNRDVYISKDVRDAYLFTTPLLIFLVLFIIVPVTATLLYSFFVNTTFLPKTFIGLTNFYALLRDSLFWQSVRFTFLFAVVSVSLELILGLLCALILNERSWFRGPLMVIMLIPWVIPIAVSARIWQIIYNYNYGIINYFLLKTGLCSTAVNWLGTARGAFFSLVVGDVWKTTPFMTIIILSGLSSIPQDIYKQAMVDGASLFQRFYKITLPLLKPALVVALLFRTIDAIRVFDLIYVLSGGGPGGSTTSLSFYAYSFYISGDFGYGSAVSVLIFFITFGLSLLYIKVGRFSEVFR